MVKFGLPIFYHFGLMVKNSAFRFSYDSAFWIRPNGPIRMDPASLYFILTENNHEDIFWVKFCPPAHIFELVEKVLSLAQEVA